MISRLDYNQSIEAAAPDQPSVYKARSLQRQSSMRTSETVQKVLAHTLKRRRSSDSQPAYATNPAGQRQEHGANDYSEPPSRFRAQNPSTDALQDAGRRKRQNAINQASEDSLMKKWVAEEDVFVLKQAKKKAAIRVRDGRGKPIDWLTVLLLDLFPEDDLLDEDAYPTVPNFSPDMIFQSLNAPALAIVIREIDANATLDRNIKIRAYWEDVGTLCADFQSKLEAKDRDSSLRSVKTDIDSLLASKSESQLHDLERMVDAKLGSQGAIDFRYWQELSRCLKVKIASARMLRLCQVAWRRKAGLKRAESGSSPSAKVPIPKHNALLRTDGCVSLVDANGVESSTSVQAKSGATPTSSMVDHSTASAAYEKELARGLNEDEEIFTGEEPLAASGNAPLDKLHPRKPRYFNRVQMGYEWNKYNQTHYDHENPPPKVVQGYHFNIFYPDLVDQTKAPNFRIIRENGRKRGQTTAPAGEDDTCIIRFSSGSPYQDIAFRIIDKEWDFSSKRDRGFRSTFEKGILQVHFQFKKVYYRK